MSIARSPLNTFYDINNKWEIGVDEAGRGPLFGRLYVAAVILPKDASFCHKDIRDSKKITSHKKIRELAKYIKDNSVAWYVHYIEADVIDEINIRQAVLKAMHVCIRTVMETNTINQMANSITTTSANSNIHDNAYHNEYMLLIDGNDFKPYMVYDEAGDILQQIPHVTIEGGDNLYTPIAAASILAKVDRDDYIANLCSQYPDLSTRYGLNTNMGYGTKTHLAGILTHGITQWHRRTYGCCKTAAYSPLTSIVPFVRKAHNTVLGSQSSTCPK
jgi:ribonuclease HII